MGRQSRETVSRSSPSSSSTPSFIFFNRVTTACSDWSSKGLNNLSAICRLQESLAYLMQENKTMSPTFEILSLASRASSSKVISKASILDRRTFLSMVGRSKTQRSDRSSGRRSLTKYCRSLFIRSLLSFQSVTWTWVETAAKFETCSLRWLQEMISFASRRSWPLSYFL